jgi:hypothetical protein
VALVEQAAGGAEQRGGGLLVGEHRGQLGQLGGGELLLALRDQEVRRVAGEELALLDVEAAGRTQQF